MIIRERDHDFILVEQHNHALASGELIKQWKMGSFIDSPLQESVIFATQQHDAGWIPADKQPFWNDAKEMPYSFIDFPAPMKTLLYSHGIDQVQSTDLYSALLCSEHYVRFLKQDDTESGRIFVEQEKKRQEIIHSSLASFDEKLFSYHYALLQFCDNLSLFLCLNEPGENSHPFFTKGIPLSSALPHFSQEKMALTWANNEEILIKEFPFKNPFSITYTFKKITKNQIRKNGLINSYVGAPFKQTTIQIKEKQES
ncbi:DUF3891 family protein [Oceanobacillus manasiensis]|uniref:DUF3891 family protein n=1 Tax=Oceanobacillus manasiensis TaxID=586413 RepID=UPI0005A5D9BC|nr:DUF3891 family protein [Oceanobacillus manasiensis]